MRTHPHISKTYRVIALLVALWLPAQALAGVLLHCETTDASYLQHMQESAAPDDCHGHAVAAVDTTPASDSGTSKAADCYHCTGGCHKMQSMMPLAKQQLADDLPSDRQDSAIADGAAGYPDYPIRPPRSFPFS